jgi:hypothetical protein
MLPENALRFEVVRKFTPLGVPVNMEVGLVPREGLEMRPFCRRLLEKHEGQKFEGAWKVILSDSAEKEVYVYTIDDLSADRKAESNET